MFNNGLKEGTKVFIEEAEVGAWGANYEIGVVVNDCDDKLSGCSISQINRAFLVKLRNGSVWNVGTQAKYHVLNADETEISSTVYRVEESNQNNGSTANCNGIKAPRTKFHLAIKRVIHHEPETIVYWENGDRTVVKVNGEKYDSEKGLAMAIIKYMTGNYNDIFRTFCPEVEVLDIMSRGDNHE